MCCGMSELVSRGEEDLVALEPLPAPVAVSEPSSAGNV